MWTTLSKNKNKQFKTQMYVQRCVDIIQSRCFKKSSFGRLKVDAWVCERRWSMYASVVSFRGTFSCSLDKTHRGLKKQRIFCCLDENSIVKTLKLFFCLGIHVIVVVVSVFMCVCFFLLRLIHMELHDFVKASECFEMCIKSNGSSCWIRYHLILSLARQGRFFWPCVALCSGFFFIFTNNSFAHIITIR